MSELAGRAEQIGAVLVGHALGAEAIKFDDAGSSETVSWTRIAMQVVVFPLTCLVFPVPLASWWVRADGHRHPVMVGLASALTVATAVVGVLWLLLQAHAAF